MCKFVALIGFLLNIASLHAQEVNCKTIILDNQIQLTDKRIFRSLEQAISEFVNNTKWSADKIQTNEKIELTIQFIPSKYDQQGNYMEGNAQIICQRPVYGSTYTTNTLNILDEDWKFNYVEFQRMDYNENSFTNNLVALVAFYVNYAFAGTPCNALILYFNKALGIANQSQSSDGSSGWKPFQRNIRARYNLIDNALNPRFEPIRQAYYKYHRQGLDVMFKDPEIARKAIFTSLEMVQKVFKIAPNTAMLIVFFEAKSDELVNIYKGASPTEKSKAIELLIEINVANINKYEKIRS